MVNKTGGGDGVQRRDVIAMWRRISPFQSFFSETFHRHVGGGKQKKVLSIRNVLINISFDNRNYLLIFFICLLHMCDEMEKMELVYELKQLKW